jgi:ribA/ribD-fused uncharacterized protein
MTTEHIVWDKRDAFSGKYAFLSNFHPSRIIYPFMGEPCAYETVEHGYQAAKACNIKDHNYIAYAPHPGTAKFRGRKVVMRQDWDEIKDSIMLDLVRLKFMVHADLAQLLLDTGDNELIEYNTWNDDYWGKIRTRTPLGPEEYMGRNQLGVTLMVVRNELANTKSLRRQISKRTVHYANTSKPVDTPTPDAWPFPITRGRGRGRS